MQDHNNIQNNKDNNTTVIPKEDLLAASNNNTVKGILTRVYKFFMVSFGKDRTPVWNKLMDQYVNDPANNISSYRSKRTSIRGNMKREYLGPQLSWPKFCEAMRFARFKKLEIVFIAEDENGNSMTMRENLDFASIPDSDFVDDLVESRVAPYKRELDLTGIGEDAKKVIMNAVNSSKAFVATHPNIAGSTTPNKVMSRGKDWVSRTPEEVEKIIVNNTVKEPEIQKTE